MNYPKVSIIILNWNGYQDTTECLESLKQLDYPNYEIILVDNGSMDGSPDRLKKEFSRIKLIKNPENLGFAEGNNVGIRHALKKRTDYVLLLNNDTKIDPKFLKELVRAAESDPRIGVVGPKIYYYDHPDTIWFAGGTFNKYTGQTYHIGLNQVDKGQFDKQEEVDFITGCCFLVKNKVIEEVGMLDPDYFNSYEDVDWSLRIKRSSYQLIYVPPSIIWHKFARAMGGRFSPFYIYYRVRNNLLFDIKNKRSKIHFMFHLIFSPMKHVVYGALTLHFRGIRAAFLGLIDFLRGRYGRGPF